MVEFKLAKHIVRDVEMVEIYVDGVFCGALYLEGPNAVRLISTHLAGEPHAVGVVRDVWRFVFQKPGFAVPDH